MDFANETRDFFGWQALSYRRYRWGDGWRDADPEDKVTLREWTRRVGACSSMRRGQCACEQMAHERAVYHARRALLQAGVKAAHLPTDAWDTDGSVPPDPPPCACAAAKEVHATL